MKFLFLLLATLPLAPSAQQATGVKSVDARDVLERMGTDFDAPRLGVPRPIQAKTVARDLAAGTEAEPDAVAERRRRVAASAKLESILRGQLRIEAAAPGDAKWLRVSEDGALTASLEAAEQARLDELLACMRAFDELVMIEARYVELPKAAARKLGIDATSTLATMEERDVLLESLMSEGADILASPRVLMQPLQQASLYVGDVVNYVEDWSVHTVEPGGAEVLDPRIMEVRLGTFLVARAVPLPADKLSLSLEIGHATIAKPMRTSRVQFGSREVEVALPEISNQRVRMELTVAPRATTLLPIPSEGGRMLLVFVTADVMPESK